MSTRPMKRIYHTWDKWESYPAGFFNNTPPKGLTKEDCERLYAELLSDTDEFGRVLQGVITEWKNACEHNLTNVTLNRIAWMGQAALSYKYNIPAQFRGGYNRLTATQQAAADAKAHEYINRWMDMNGYPPVESEIAEAVNLKQSLY